MNTPSLVAAALAAFIGTAAFAQEAGVQQVVVQKTRAEVIAELQAAQARGERSFGDSYGYDITARPFVSTRTRAEVKAELAQARANGEIGFGDTYGYDVASKPFVSTKTRAQVQAEAAQALRSGQRLSQGDFLGG
ncbi:DUF4148 domain-containing protein [Aquincola sp. MAHUQ-54]|uniref:DUF4148 domain-containing protein n=1 Tax=Aquincola agrisoli TaxID=3119538 RepID=A0AAW9Q3K2_9BURK